MKKPLHRKLQNTILLCTEGHSLISTGSKNTHLLLQLIRQKNLSSRISLSAAMYKNKPVSSPCMLSTPLKSYWLVFSPSAFIVCLWTSSDSQFCIWCFNLQLWKRRHKKDGPSFENVHTMQFFPGRMNSGIILSIMYLRILNLKHTHRQKLQLVFIWLLSNKTHVKAIEHVVFFSALLFPSRKRLNGLGI